MVCQDTVIKLFKFTDLRKHDVCFLITVRPTQEIGTRYDYTMPFKPQCGMVYVRGCEVEGMLDNQGRVIEEGNAEFHIKPFDINRYLKHQYYGIYLSRIKLTFQSQTYYGMCPT